MIRGAREHNLRNISLDLPRDRLIVFTGLSGSGKSSLAFDTIYAEGQRRYVESLSAYARQFLGQMDKPDVDFIEGLSPAISIDQKSASRNPRSTVGTITEVYDYLRLLYARIGVPHCPHDGTVITRQTPQQIVDRVLDAARGHPLPGAGAGGAGPQGQLREPADRPRHPGLRPGPDRRRDARAHRQGRPGPLRAAHDRGGHRPAGQPRGHRAPAHRLARDRAAPGRRRGRGAARARARATRPRRRSSPSASTWPAPRAVAATTSWRPATSRSTRPTAPASTATAWAPASRSTPSWSWPTRRCRSREGAIQPVGRRARAVLPPPARGGLRGAEDPGRQAVGRAHRRSSATCSCTARASAGCT